MSSISGAGVPAVARGVPATGLAEAITLRLLVPLATMLVIGAVALLILFTPFWLHPALDAADSAAWLAMTPQAAHDYSDRTVGDLVFASGDFAFSAPDGTPFFDEAERAHMRDVRVVLYGFLALSALAAVGLAIITYRRRADAAVWRGISRGGAWLVVGTLVVGAFSAVAFDQAFELFHEIFFPGGNFNFDPATQRLVQLYPFAFWQYTSAALGVLLIAGGGLSWFFARRLARRRERA